MKRGYNIIDPGLALPKYALDFDTQVQYLSYLLTQIGKLNSIPENVFLEIIPVQYLGGPYPAIGLYTETFVDTPEGLTNRTFVIGDQLSAYITEIGIDRLREVSSQETLRWQDILKQHEY